MYPAASTQEMVNDVSEEFAGEIAYMQADVDGDGMLLSVRRDIETPQLSLLVRNIDSVEKVEHAEDIVAL